MKKTAILLTIFIVISSVSFAHPGRTDSNGGHYNRSTGEYHYHDGSSSGSYSFSDSSTETINSYTYEDWEKEQEYNKLERQVSQYKEELEQAGYNSITDISNKLQEKESEISNLWSLFIVIFIIGIAIAYNVGVNKKINAK